MIRDYRISHGVLTYYEEAPYSIRSKRCKRVIPIGGDCGKPRFILRLKGILWKWVGL